jgi:hypothetical protein
MRPPFSPWPHMATRFSSSTTPGRIARGLGGAFLVWGIVALLTTNQRMPQSVSGGCEQGVSSPTSCAA